MNLVNLTLPTCYHIGRFDFLYILFLRNSRKFCKFSIIEKLVSLSKSENLTKVNKKLFLLFDNIIINWSNNDMGPIKTLNFTSSLGLL